MANVCISLTENTWFYKIIQIHNFTRKYDYHNNNTCIHNRLICIQTGLQVINAYFVRENTQCWFLIRGLIPVFNTLTITFRDHL